MADDPSASGRPVELLTDPDIALARQRLDEAAARQTSTVGYTSDGHCLVIGALEPALEASARLAAAGLAGCTLVSVDVAATRVSKALTESGTALFTVPALRLEGHLGAFSATAVAGGAETDLGVPARRPQARFDLVLDLSPTPLLDVGLPPFGYAHARDETTFAAAIERLAELVGEFDKPRYFAYDASICAHSRSRLAGCSNCLDVCVTGAISPAGDGVSVDPYLCQGCGSCATLCPSGAMVYAYPKPSESIARTRALIAERRELVPDGATTLVLHGESLQGAVDAAALPAEALALVVEEVAAFGIDYWASVLCAGVGRILAVTDAPADDPNRRALETQAALLQRLVEGLGVGPDIVRVIGSAALAGFAELPGPSAALVALARTPASFATHDDKRQTIRLALDTLAAALAVSGAASGAATGAASTAAMSDAAPDVAPDVASGTGSGTGSGTASPPPIEALPAGSPFGRIRVDTDACTLCMACVSTCPAGALLDGQDTPALRMIEANCVQCGLCEQACPEEAISLEARYLRDSVAARRIVTLHEEAPFHCVVCHRAFATRAVIDTMLGKLSGHWMFRDEKARRRLKMCEDCRVRDIFESEAGGIDVHRESGEGR